MKSKEELLDENTKLVTALGWLLNSVSYEISRMKESMTHAQLSMEMINLSLLEVVYRFNNDSEKDIFSQLTNAYLEGSGSYNKIHTKEDKDA